MKDIYVTESFLPPIDEYKTYIDKIWENKQLTNSGPLLVEFESRVKQFIGSDNFNFVTNGTLALQLALNALDITEGEIITTPFSYVATTSAILWERCTPVFVDIEPATLCIDPEKIEAAITDRTKAIMPVHVFGYPCDVEKIQSIADKHGLKVIYDGAHAFGVERNGRSLLLNGDITISSFHATKLMQTIEGGGLVARDQAVFDKIDLKKRFGHNGDEHFMLGMNAKASEFQAAMGLCNIKYIDEIISARKSRHEAYDVNLGDSVRTLKPADNVKHNYAYYPALFKDEKQRITVQEALAKERIFARRYFYPSLNQLPYISEKAICPVSESISESILCLPLSTSLPLEDVERISKIIKANI